MRETVIQPTSGGTTAQRIALVRDEWRRLSILGMDTASLTLTIAADPAAAPMIEIPGTGGFDLHPAAVQALTEGASYHYNVWCLVPSGNLQRIAEGRLDISPSIAPSGVDVATTFLADFGQPGAPQRIVTLTRSQWEVQVSPDIGTIYLIVEDPE